MNGSHCQPRHPIWPDPCHHPCQGTAAAQGTGPDCYTSEETTLHINITLKTLAPISFFLSFFSFNASGLKSVWWPPSENMPLLWLKGLSHDLGIKRLAVQVWMWASDLSLFVLSLFQGYLNLSVTITSV